MRLYSHIALSTALIAALALPAFCQEPSPEPAPLSSDRVNLDAQIAKMKAQFDSADVADLTDKAAAMADRAAVMADGLSKMDLPMDIAGKVAQLKFQFDSKGFDDLDAAAAVLADKANLAFLQAPAAPAAPMPPMPPRGKIFINPRGDGEYDAGTRALDQHKYDEAVRHYDAVVNSKSARADGALYWKAYSLNREGKRDDALAALAELRRDYASSAWLNDAQALEAEVKQNAGQPVSPNQESNDDLKLLAINSLMNADAERAIPLIEGILKGNSAPNVKDNALFVLAHSKSQRAQQVLADYAKGAGNPDMQLRAIQYVGMSGTKDAQQLLAGVYGTSADTRVKTSILQSLMVAHATDLLLNIAKTEKDANLRNTAIRQLAADRSVPSETLLELYAASDTSAKKEIVNGFTGRRDAKTLVDLARKETDPAMKRYIVERLGDMRDSKEAMDYMMELLK